MDDFRRIRLKKFHGELGEIVYEMTQVQMAQFCPPETWSPAINAFQDREKIMLCVELAGVGKEAIDLRVEPRRVLLRGRRQAFEPDDIEEGLQILAMEIDYGAFERIVELPADVDPERVRAEQKNGILWVFLPFRSVA